MRWTFEGSREETRKGLGGDSSALPLRLEVLGVLTPLSPLWLLRFSWLFPSEETEESETATLLWLLCVLLFALRATGSEVASLLLLPREAPRRRCASKDRTLSPRARREGASGMSSLPLLRAMTRARNALGVLVLLLFPTEGWRPAARTESAEGEV